MQKNCRLRVVKKIPDEMLSVGLNDDTPITEGTLLRYNVKLEGGPPATGETVTVTVMSSNMSVTTVSPASLTFTSANWDRDRELHLVTITGVRSRERRERTATITHTSRGGGYSGQAKRVQVTVTDDDRPWSGCPIIGRGIRRATENLPSEVEQKTRGCRDRGRREQ